MPAGTRPVDGSTHASNLRPNRLILCFDGTGNVFKGTPADTNIVKLYKMLDRSNMSQMHYYQPGIGTYPAEGPVNVGFFRSMTRKLEAVMDEALATSFDSHVIAGYRFLMRNYRPGDQIYVFGFSRGAFTARFLSRMISHVGLLSSGNDELVPFAYKVYQEYEQNRSTSAQERDDHVKYMNAFKMHFCRTEHKRAEERQEHISINESGIKVHFLGLFDCVSSVGNLDVPFFEKQPPLPAVVGTAKHVRHAVAIDERRVKFKAALFSQDEKQQTEDIKEVWFPGNHGDIGGGWDVPAEEDGLARESNDDDYFQLSDIPLKWMVDEIDNVELGGEPDSRLAWNSREKASFLNRFQKKKDQMISARMHDTMTFSGGSSSKFSVMMWKFIELLPFVVKRWEYVESPRRSGSYAWKYIGWPPSLGSRRAIPSAALFHQAAISRMRLIPDLTNFRPKLYMPNNNLWVQGQHFRATTAQPDLEERNLSELAKLKGQQNGLSHSNDRQRPLKREIHFEHVEELTRGSVAIDGEQVVVGPENWDRVYRVVLNAS